MLGMSGFGEVFASVVVAIDTTAPMERRRTGGEAAASHASTREEGDTMTDAREVRDKYTAAFNVHDMDALLRTVSPTGVTVSPEGLSQGHEELASYIGQFWEAFPDVYAMVVESFDVGDVAVDELLMVGTHKGPYMMPDGQVITPTGRPVSLRCCYVCTVENGLIVSLRLYFDQLELRAQLGVPCG